MGAPGAVETEEQEINPPVKMRLERSAERDKREIINNSSAIDAQSNAERIPNRPPSLQRKLTKKFLSFLQCLQRVIRIQGIRARKGLRSYRAAGGSGFPQSPARRAVTEDRYNDGKA